MATQTAITFEDVRAEKKRTANQRHLILGRLLKGRATNAELYGYALNLTARISELRKAGHVIKVVGRDYATGIVWYALFVNGEEARTAA